MTRASKSAREADTGKIRERIVGYLPLLPDIEEISPLLSKTCPKDCRGTAHPLTAEYLAPRKWIVKVLNEELTTGEYVPLLTSPVTMLIISKQTS